MAGGEGTRLRPLTSNQPKPMVPIVGKPCMEHILELLHAQGIDDVAITLAFMPQAIRTYFGDGDALGMSIEYSVEEEPLGTAGSVKLAARESDEPFLVISGDALCDVDLNALVKYPHRAGCRRHDRPQVGGQSARVRHRRHRRRRAGRALPREALLGQVFSDTINTGLYVLDPEVLNHVPAGRSFDFSSELFPLLLEMGRPIYAAYSTATGRTSATWISTGKRTSTLSTRRCS